MTQRKSYITGIGAITTAGFDLESCWKNLLEGAPKFERESNYSVGRLNDSLLLEELKTLPKKIVESTDRAVVIGALAAKHAFENAKNPEIKNMGVIIGSSRGATDRLEREIESFNSDKKVSFQTSPATTSGAFSSTVSRLLGTGGISLSVSSACSTGLNAMGVGHSLIKSGVIDSCLSGGAEAAVTPFTVEMLGKLRVLSKSTDPVFPCKSFHPERNGMALSEGAAILCIESSPKTDPIAEIIGFGSASEQSTLTGLSPDGDGIISAINRALEEAEIKASDVDLVVAHGSGTKKGDAAEIAAYHTIFKSTPPPVTCHKWLTGHMLAASSSFSVGLATKHLKYSMTPELPYFKGEELELVRGRKLSSNKIALIVALGFGGSACAMLIKNPC